MVRWRRDGSAMRSSRSCRPRRSNRVRHPRDPYPRALRRPGGDPVDPPHPDPPRAGRGVRGRRLRPGAGSSRACARRRPRARARSTPSRRSPRRGRTRRRSSSWRARSTRPSTAWVVASSTRRPTRAARSRWSPRTSAGRGRPQAIPAAVGEALLPVDGRPAAAGLRRDADRPRRLRRSSGRRPVVELPGPGRAGPECDRGGAARLLRGRPRVVLMPGAGVQRAGASAELRRLAIRLGAPVVMAVTGAGVDPGRRRVVGRGAHPRAARNGPSLLAAADACSWSSGRRLDDVRTARWTLPLPNLVHIDVDPAASGGPIRRRPAIVGDARLALEGSSTSSATGRRPPPTRTAVPREPGRPATATLTGVAARRAGGPRRVPRGPRGHAARRDPDPRCGPRSTPGPASSGRSTSPTGRCCRGGRRRSASRSGRPTARRSRLPAGASSRPAATAASCSPRWSSRRRSRTSST